VPGPGLRPIGSLRCCSAKEMYTRFAPGCPHVIGSSHSTELSVYMNPTKRVHSLSVLVAPEQDSDGMGSKSLLGASRRDELVLKEIPVARLQEQLTQLSLGISELLDAQVHEAAGQFRLTEVAVQAEINASGGINLIGTATVGGSAAITLTFSR